MSKKLTFQGAGVRFPVNCVICEQPAACEYKIERIFTYGNRSITITLPVPMCDTHHAMATRKSAKEQAVGKLGIGLGALAGLASAGGLLAYWASTNQGNLLLNGLMALVVGAGAFLILWVLFTGWIAPMFADPESKAARNAVKIALYRPNTQELTLEFFNEQVAERVGRLN